jgi:TRAP-type mannitol/chloroaromatic compound transport system substrate-binding protein
VTRAAPALAALLFVLVAGCGGDGAPARGAGADPGAERFEWTLVSTMPRGLPGPGTAAERFAARVEAMSGGRLAIRFAGAGELVPAFEVFDAVAQGRAQMGHGAAFYWRGKVPEAAFFAAVPFGMNAQETNGWLYHGGGLELWRTLYAPHGVIPFPGGNSGAQMGGWFGAPVEDLDAYRGLRMRIQGLGAEVFERAGGLAVSLPAGEVFTALSAGTIDAAEWVGPYNDLTFGLFRAAEVYHGPGWQEPGAALELIVNAEAWAALPADLQAIVDTAARVLNADVLDEMTARSGGALATLRGRHGVRVEPFPPEVLAELRRLSDVVVDEQGARSPMAERIHASYRAYQDAVTDWHRVSEEAYLDARRDTAPD